MDSTAGASTVSRSKQKSGPKGQRSRHRNVKCTLNGARLIENTTEIMAGNTHLPTRTRSQCGAGATRNETQIASRKTRQFGTSKAEMIPII